VLVCEISDNLAFEVARRATHLSLPSLAEPVAMTNVRPLPPPRRKTYTCHEQECASNSDNCVSSIAKSELFENVELDGSRKAKSSEDIQTLCTSSDPCLHENNSVQATEFDSSVGNGNFSVGYTLTADTCIAVSTNQRTVKHTRFVPPVKPLRHKQQATNKPLESAGGLDVDEISDVAVRPKIKSVDKCESSSAQEDKATFPPQPKPRTSLLRNSTTLCSVEANQVARKLSHNESAVQNSSNAEASMDFPCLDAKSDTDSPQKVSVADDAGKDKVNEAEQLLDCCELDDTSSNEQNLLKVKNDTAVEVQRSSIIVPSRTAPSPPLPIPIIVTQPTTSMLPLRVAPPPPVPRPKVRMHSSGLPEDAKCSCNSEVSESKASSDTDNVSDSIPTSSLSGKMVNEGNQHQLGNDEVYLRDSAPTRDTESDDSSVFYPDSTSGIHTSVVSSTTVPVAVDSLTKGDESCKRKGPAVPRRRKPTPACRRSLDVSNYVKNKNVNYRIPDTRRRSENIVRGNDSSTGGHSLSLDAAPKPYPQEDGIPGFTNLSLTGDHETAADMQKNSSPGESCSSLADTISVSACSPLEPSFSPLALMSPEIPADTPPITPTAFRFDNDDPEARTVC